MTRTDDLRAEYTRQFNRRFWFGINAAFSTIFALILFFLTVTHPLNMARLVDGTLAFAGFPSPYMPIGGLALLGFVLLHGMWLLWREGTLTGRRAALAGHTIAAAASALILLVLVNSWWMTEPENNPSILEYHPLANAAPPAFVWLLLLLTVLALLPHALWWVHGELLNRTLKHSNDVSKPKRGHKDIAFFLDDDGELVIESETDDQKRTTAR